MAPNRFKVTQLVDSLESIDINSLLQQKNQAAAYLPLTHPSEQAKEQLNIQQQVVEEEQEYITAEHVNEETNYWDWNDEPVQEDEYDDYESNEIKKQQEKQRIIQQILREEEIRSVLSIDHIEANIMRNKSNKQGDIVESNVDSDDYWAASEDSEDNDQQVPVATTVTTQHSGVQSYWDWPTLTKDEKKQQVIDTLLQYEKARQLLSVDHIVQNIVSSNATTSSSSNVVINDDPAFDSERYWSWHQNPKRSDTYFEWKTQTPQESKQEIIDNIMREEEIRQMLDVERMIEKEHYKKTAPVTIVTSSESTSSSPYWDWQ